MPDFHSPQPACAVAMSQIRSDVDAPVSRLSNAILKTAAELRPERRRQYLTGRALLAELLFQTVGIAELPEMVTGDNGRPSFVRHELPDFNISHSDDYIMVALANRCRIGLDVELMRPRKRLIELAEYSFSAGEYQWLRQLAEERREQAFWRLWTIRESILKLAGKGVWQMKEITVDPHNRRVKADFSPTLNCWSNRCEPLLWSVTADKSLAAENISLWRATPDLSRLLPQPLPELTLLKSD